MDAPDQRIQLRRHAGSDADLTRLYRRYDALLYTSRGSAGLIAMEAMATGLPVFHTGRGALEAIKEFGTVVESRERVAFKAAHPSADCFEMHYDVLATHLMHFDQDSEPFTAAAKAAAPRIAGTFTWKRTASSI